MRRSQPIRGYRPASGGVVARPNGERLGRRRWGGACPWPVWVYPHWRLVILLSGLLLARIPRSLPISRPAGSVGDAEQAVGTPRRSRRARFDASILLAQPSIVGSGQSGGVSVGPASASLRVFRFPVPGPSHRIPLSARDRFAMYDPAANQNSLGCHCRFPARRARCGLPTLLPPLVASWSDAVRGSPSVRIYDRNDGNHHDGKHDPGRSEPCLSLEWISA